MVSFAEVWKRIERHQAQIFGQVRGGEFSYVVRGSALIPDRTNRNLPKSSFEKAFDLMPVSGPGALQHLQGPSYLFAILIDPRIRKNDW